jgi:polyisoprenoid-binding protein YceI
VGAMPSVRFTVAARKLAVTPEKGVSQKDQAEIQANMQNKVLESSSHPEITFQSTEVPRYRDNVWKVSGDLMLHRVTRLLTFDVARESGAYVGIAHINQTDFEIQSVKIGGGLVKVKDELKITFRVYPLAR